jgi:hypothetical protein
MGRGFATAQTEAVWVEIGEIRGHALAEQLVRMGGEEAVRSPAAPLQGIDILARRLREELTAGAISAAQARGAFARLQPDGSWPDLDYDDRAQTHWSPGQHPRRLAQLAAAYCAHLYTPDEADGLEHAILSALVFWVERDPQSDNGWYNNIHTPQYLAQTLLLMGDTVPLSIWDQAVQIVRRSECTRNGADLAWKAGNLLTLACATRDACLLRQAVKAIANTIETDAPCVLMIQHKNDGFALSVADPTQSRRKMQIRITNQLDGPGCTFDPTRGISVIAVDLPTGDDGRQTVQIVLRAG